VVCCLAEELVPNDLLFNTDLWAAGCWELELARTLWVKLLHSRDRTRIGRGDTVGAQRFERFTFLTLHDPAYCCVDCLVLSVRCVILLFSDLKGPAQTRPWRTQKLKNCVEKRERCGGLECVVEDLVQTL
jgi:hypothetical protein